LSPPNAAHSGNRISALKMATRLPSSLSNTGQVLVVLMIGHSSDWNDPSS
jgi:hypothetical protein